MNPWMQPLPQSGSTMARAIVRANNDPDKNGRIKVEYPWFHGDTAQIPSEWARTCIPYASKNSGAWFLPEVGDEVLVFFENGNLDFPIVMGTLYSPKNPPPQCGRAGDLNADNKNHLKFFRTRSGHVLCFDDSDSNQGIVIKDGDNRRIEIKSSDKKILVSDEADNSICIDGPKITIKNSAGDQISIKSGEITIESSGKINLGQGASHPLIFGDLFSQLFNAHVHSTNVGPSGPPSTPLTPAMMSQKVKTN